MLLPCTSSFRCSACLLEQIVHIAFDASRPQTVLLQSHSFLCQFDLSKSLLDLKSSSSSSSSSSSRSSVAASPARKRPRSAASNADPFDNDEDYATAADDSAGAFHLIEKYRPLLLADFVEPRFVSQDMMFVR